MKQIIIIAIMIGSGVVNLWLGISITKQKATIAEQGKLLFGRRR